MPPSPTCQAFACRVVTYQAVLEPLSCPEIVTRLRQRHQHMIVDHTVGESDISEDTYNSIGGLDAMSFSADWRQAGMLYRAIAAVPAYVQSQKN